jgi:hypothetical protein
MCNCASSCTNAVLLVGQRFSLYCMELCTAILDRIFFKLHFLQRLNCAHPYRYISGLIHQQFSQTNNLFRRHAACLGSIPILSDSGEKFRLGFEDFDICEVSICLRWKNEIKKVHRHTVNYPAETYRRWKPVGIKPILLGKPFIGVNDAGVSLVPRMICFFWHWLLQLIPDFYQFHPWHRRLIYHW